MTKARAKPKYDLNLKDIDYDLENLPVISIVWPEDRFGAVQTERSEAALEQTLKDLPLLNEIGVRPDGEAFIGIYGKHRFDKLIASGKLRVRCKVWKVDGETAMYMQLAENTARGGYDNARMLDYFVRLLDSKKFNQRAIARLLGVDKSEISKLKQVSSMDDRLKRIYVEKHVPLDVMYELRQLSNVEAQVSALTSVITGSHSKETARHFIRHILAACCDKCRTTASERNSDLPLTLYDGKWLCSECHKPAKAKQSDHTTAERETEQTMIEGSKVVDDLPVSFTCLNCHEDTLTQSQVIAVCEKCYGKLMLVQALTIQRLGDDYWKMTDAQIKKQLALPRP